MNSKHASTLQKVAQERERGDFHKALKRLADAIQKDGDDLTLYLEAIEVALETSDSLQAVEYFKRAHSRFPNEVHELWNLSVRKLGEFNDAILASYLFELALKKRELGTAEEILEVLKDQTVNDLLKRTRNKKQTLSSAMSGSSGFRREIMVNALAEAMLCIRTKRFQEGMRLFLRILDDKPIEHETLTPLFERLEKSNKRKGSIIFGLGCCLLAGHKYSKGLQKVVAGVELAPTLAKTAIARLEEMPDNLAIEPGEMDYSLARLHLINGDTLLAAARLNAVIVNGSAKASVVVELLGDYIDVIGEDLALHLLYLNAALQSKREDRALKHVRRIYKSTGHRAELLEWFETRAQSLPPEFQVAHGEMLLDQGMHERAVEIFRTVLAGSPHEQHTVAAALARYGSDPHAQALLSELSTEDEQARGKPAGNGLEIEHYGNSDGFSFDPARQAEANAAAHRAPPTQVQNVPPTQTQETPPAEAGQAPEPQPLAPEPTGQTMGLSGDRDPFAAPPPTPEPPSAPDPTPSIQEENGIVRQEAPFGNTKPPVAPKRREGWGEPPRPERRSELPPRTIHLSGPAGAHEPKPAAPEPPVAAPTPVAPEPPVATPTPTPTPVAPEPPVATPTPAPVAPEPPVEAPTPTPAAPAPPANPEPAAPVQSAPQAPAPTNAPHDPGTAPIILGPPREPVNTPAEPPAPGAPASPTAGPAPSYHVTLSYDEAQAAQTHAPATTPEPPNSFEGQYSKFKRGELTNAEVLKLIKTAHRDGHWQEMKSLLAFQPANIGEDVKRKFHLAGYYLDLGQALAALVVIRTVNVTGLGREERRAFLLRLANCYRVLNRFDAAHSVYLRMMSEEEDFPKLEEIARSNYRQYVDQLAADAPVLEKITLV